MIINPGKNSPNYRNATSLEIFGLNSTFSTA